MSHLNPGQIVASIVALANHAATLAVDEAMDAARAERAGKVERVAAHVSRIAVGAAVAVGEIAWMAGELERSEALDLEIATAGLAVTNLQASLLAIATAVDGVGVAGGPVEAVKAAAALRTAALTLDELLPAYQPAP
ncbi:hypothetical protein [Solirubrobacter soli]|uniref:hypothetical protein n=1 Tax=Solirubrobacter soli TaxID=363832 RepID=UPI00047F82E6|nr:hypothetical protein [Solirubrobacter soli]